MLHINFNFCSYRDLRSSFFRFGAWTFVPSIVISVSPTLFSVTQIYVMSRSNPHSFGNTLRIEFPHYVLSCVTRLVCVAQFPTRQRNRHIVKLSNEFVHLRMKKREAYNRLFPEVKERGYNIKILTHYTDLRKVFCL